MKKLLLIFSILFSSIIYGQHDYLEILTDTTELKLYAGSGMCLLEKFSASDYTGGGIFIRMDSAYTENGTHAFGYPYDGYQWVRLPYIGGELSAFQDLSATSITSTGASDLAGDITLENDEVIDNSTDGDVFLIFNDDDDSLGQFVIKSSIDTPGIADNDHLDLFFQSKDDSAGETVWGKLITTITDASDESEDSKMEVKTLSAGTGVSSMVWVGTQVVSYPINYGTAAMVTGSADSIVIDFTPDLPALQAGLEIAFLSEAANTGATTLIVDGGTEKNIYEQVAATPNALDANDIRSGCIVKIIYDGTQWILISPSGN